MSTIELEAREALTRRRQALCGTHAAHAGAPDARWTDYDAMPPALPETAQIEVEEIDAALKRIGEGHYGQCLACGGPIGLQRLRAVPEAKYCLSCAGKRPEE